MLFGRMCQLAREIAIVIVDELGPEEMLRRLSKYLYQPLPALS